MNTSDYIVCSAEELDAALDDKGVNASDCLAVYIPKADPPYYFIMGLDGMGPDIRYHGLPKDAMRRDLYLLGVQVHDT